MSERIDEDLTLQALVMALDWRHPTGELMHHSDSNNVSTSFSTARPSRQWSGCRKVWCREVFPTA